MKPSASRPHLPSRFAAVGAALAVIPLCLYFANQRTPRAAQSATTDTSLSAAARNISPDTLAAAVPFSTAPLTVAELKSSLPAFRILNRLAEPVVINNPLTPDESAPSSILTITSSSLIDPASLEVIQRAQRGDAISFPHPQGGWIPAVVSNRTELSQDGSRSIAGSLANRPGHQFSLIFKSGTVSGMLLLPDEKRALLLQQDPEGRLLLQDKPIDTVICHGMPVAPGEGVFARSTKGAEYNVTVPILDSRPSATAVLYLDFDGEVVNDPNWNAGQTILAEPAVMGGSPITPAQITTVWEMVSEDFRPFNISVTTSLSRYTNAPVGQRMRCIQTPTKTVAPSAGGVAYLNSYSRAGDTFAADVPCWSFNSGNARVMAMTISHEFGHTFGLRHDGRIAGDSQSAEEYYAGHGTGPTAWGPLMGAPFSRPLTQWSKGDYYRANRTDEDDLLVIARLANKLTFRADTVGDSPANATLVEGNLFGQIDQTGVIIQSTDVDYYRFTTAGGNLSVTCGPNPTEPNLKTRLELRDESNTLIAFSDPSGQLTSSITRPINVGTYYLVVKSGSEGTPSVNPPSGFLAYGSIGSYRLTGSFVGLPVQPLIVEQPLSVSTDEGKAATFKVSVLSNSPVKYQWFKVVAGVDQIIPKATSSTYRIATTNANHIGEYRCRCTNRTGDSISDTVTLDVFLKPKITNQPSDLLADAGDDLVISLSYLGDGPLTFRWFKNNTLIVGAESDTLPLDDVIWSDAGSYKVEISNRLAKLTSRTVAIKIKSPPVFLSMPSILAIRTNGSATLSPTVVGTAPFTYRWFKDDDEILGASGRSLKLRGFPTSPGMYKVQVTNSIGVTSSLETEVFVDDRLAITQHPVAGGPYESGESASLSVESVGSDPKTYQWQLNRKDIPGATSQTLDIASLDWFHNGNFRVIVRNRVSSVTSKESKISIASPPVFTIQPVNTKGARRGRITLTAKALGTSKLTYQWRFNGQPIAKATTPKLTLTKLDAIHEGTYDVVVINPKGTTYSDPAELIVEDSPSIILHPQPSFVGIGGTLTSTVTAGGAPVLTYQWQRNKRNIIGATSETLTLPNATTADTGSFRVIASNDVGKVTSKAATIRVMIPPSIVTDPADVAIYQTQTATFNVKVTGSKPLKYRWLHDGVQVSTAATLKLTNVSMQRAGEYVVEVSNNVGSVTSEAATLTVIPIPPPTVSLLVPLTARPGHKFAVAGNHLRWTKSVTLGGKSVGFVITTALEVIATLPSTATSGQVRLTNRINNFVNAGNLAINKTADNDHFRNSVVLTGNKATSYTNTFGFTREPSEPPHLLSGNTGSAWWRWVAPASQRYTVSTLGSSFDTILAIYSGDTLESLNMVAFNDDAPGFVRYSETTFTAFQGAAYRIAIAGYSGFGPGEGDASLEIKPESASSSPLALGPVQSTNSATTASLSEVPTFDLHELIAASEVPVAAAEQAVTIGASEDEVPTTVQIWHPALPEALEASSIVTTAFTATLEQAEGSTSEDSFTWTLYNHAEDPLLSVHFHAADGSIQVVNAQGQTWTTEAQLVAGTSFRFELVTDLANDRFSLLIDGVTQLENLPLELGSIAAQIADMSAVWNRPAKTTPAAMRFQDLEIWTD